MIDNFEVMSDSQAIVATAASTKYLNLMSYIGRGEPVFLNFKVVEQFNKLTTLTVAVQQTIATDTSFGSAETVASFAVPLASLKVGFEAPLRFLPNVSKPLVRMYYTVSGTNPDEGKVFAALAVGDDKPVNDGLYLSPRNPSGAAATA
jgi:hypothetical protein